MMPRDRGAAVLPGLHLEQLELPRRGPHPVVVWLWRESCFARIVLYHVRFRLLVLALLLCVGGLLFYTLEDGHSYTEAVYFTWSLIFGEPPERFPRHWALQSLFFVVPVIGLVVIIEGIIDFALMLRDRRRSERGWCRTMAAAMNNHIVLVGLGRLGYRTFKLLRKLGEQVVVIERVADNQFLEEVRRDGAPLFICDARREAVLEDANVADARSVILATNDDLANLEIALDARRLSPKVRVVLRMFDQNMADKIRDGFNIHIAVSQTALAAPTFAMSAIAPSIVSTFVVNNQLVVLQRWSVRRDGPMCGQTIGQVMEQQGLTIVERIPRIGERMLFPPPSTELVEGDQLLVQGLYEKVQSLGDEALREAAPGSASQRA